MTTNVLTLTQEVYFDLCDILEGQSYQSIGYENRKDFLLVQREKLLRIELALNKQLED